MSTDTKQKTLACLAGVVILIVLIAAALPRLEIRPGLPLPALANGVAESKAEQPSPQGVFSIGTFWKAIFGIGLLALLIYNGYKVFRSAAWSWKDLLKSLVYICVPVMVVVIVLMIIPSVPSTSAPSAQELLPVTVEQTGPPLGPPSLNLIWLVGLGLAILLAGLGAWFIFRPAGHAGTDRLKLQAEVALQALKSGIDLKDVIMRCYWQMEQVLKEERGIEMESAMTVREFERLLEGRNVPALPVHQLTQLFETVRYGHRATSVEDERQAIDALTAIVQYSRATRSQTSP